MSAKILLTGASGFLGSQIARRLLRRPDYQIVALVRGAGREAAELRLRRLWADMPETEAMIGSRVQVLAGDLCADRLGLDPAEYRKLAESITHVVHSAAELDLDGDVSALRRINVDGTARLLRLAGEAHRHHGIERFAHVSTAYVAGGRKGEVAEKELSDGYGFSNGYEQTKFEGETLVREAMHELPVSVFRPGMVVGDSRTGEIQTFNTVYVPLRLYLSGKLRLIPARPELRLNVVPVDYVADAIAELAFEPRAVGRTFHLTIDSKYLPTARELLDAARDWAARCLDVELPPARFVPVEKLAKSAGGRIPGIPSCLLSYFGEERHYRRDNIEALLGPYEPDWKDVLPRLLQYAADRGFLRRSGRTVHEQLVHRLQSKRIPLRIHDLRAQGTAHHRSGSEMCSEISAATAALRALGVSQGDRVAIVGLNSSRYLALDAAIGLAGAVSVPLYYTSPVPEIDEILHACGARLLFVGAPALLERAGELQSPVTIVSFCNIRKPAPTGKPITAEAAEHVHTTGGHVLDWGDFLALGGDGNADPSGVHDARNGAPETPGSGTRSDVGRRYAPSSPVRIDSLATLRFTSGTTGLPRGVTFLHGQVRWLAEVVVSLLPWRARTAPARYLSFLPMNHVVEGILGTYAPAYMPVPVDVFFLEDFHGLARVLPRVRPTVFFSVPRFYDKVWDRFASGLAGRLYLSLPEHGPAGALRVACRPLLRMALLRKTGLDRCRQLIAGSAPCSDLLLSNFRELGIEIHNAYGLTEAPLVTLNRAGANRLGTVGQPLPGTELGIAEDGEVSVRGPQVTRGYYGEEGRSSDDGWLCTGDLGELDRDGNLLIRGRKKDLLITSYGKNIQPAKIEGMLREIPGMSEAMIIGDNRPSLTALLWFKERPTPHELEAVDDAVLRVNGRLSHPEQLKRWAVLAESPAIDSGELTGNLKLRRHVVLARRSDVVEMLYRGPDGRTPGGRIPGGKVPAGASMSGAVSSGPASAAQLPGVLHVGENRCA